MKTRELFLYLKNEPARYPEYEFPPKERTRRNMRRVLNNLRAMCKRHNMKWRVEITDKSIIVFRV